MKNCTCKEGIRDCTRPDLCNLHRRRVHGFQRNPQCGATTQERCAALKPENGETRDP